MAEDTVSLAELRKKEAKKNNFVPWLKKHWPALFNLKSLLWYFLFVFLLGIFWMFYSFFYNGGTQLFAWGDCTEQFTSLCYGYWDVWHHFFKTGVFELYSASTFFGTDNIGSNSYYGLFDPFDFWTVLWPRSWVPQSMAIAAALKGVVGAFCCRAYLKYLGVSEKGSRIGGVAYAFNGFLNFMAGFATTVSVVSVFPLVLLGIEKVIKEKKPTCLVFGLMLTGMISFFYLVVYCIWGVLYALWRYFWTIKKRNWKDNLAVIGVGIASFAVGIAMCAWTLLPSLRESSLSPRLSSIAAAYLDTLKTALKNKDLGLFLHYVFEMVGENPGRELQGLVGFLYPTCGFKYLPLYGPAGTNGSGYDSWTASLFVYTPLAIFFFGGLITAFREKKWDYVFAFLICVTMVFTIFPYYFFYAFTGDGYARWYIVLIPEIIYLATKEFDNLKNEPRWQMPTASLIELSLSVLAWVLVVKVIKDQSFVSANNLTYFPSEYDVPSRGNAGSLQWIVYYQIALVCGETFVMAYFRDKEYFWKIVIGFISVETIVCGNLPFAYSGIATYGPSTSSFATGTIQLAKQQDAINQLKGYDGGDYRVYNDSEHRANFSSIVGYNSGRTFDSLYNYGLSDFLRNSHITNNEAAYETYSGNYRVGSSWSGQYVNKRSAFDTVAGYKYYMIENDKYRSGDYVAWDDDSYRYNVPFGAKCVVKTDSYRIYENPYCPDLGFGVDTVYNLGNSKVEDGGYATTENPDLTYYYRALGSNGNYYSLSNRLEVQGNEATYLSAAIVDDADVEKVSASLEVKPSAKAPTGFTYINSGLFGAKKYTTVSGYGFNLKDPGSFLTDSSKVAAGPVDISYGSMSLFKGDDDKIVLSMNNGDYFNADSLGKVDLGGSYFEIGVPRGTGNEAPRVYFLGDTFNADGTVKESNVLLNFEYWMLENNQTHTDLYYSGYNDLYGFYAPGAVRHIVLCGPNPKTTYGMPIYEPHIFYMNKTDLDKRYAGLTDEEHAVYDVTHETDRFTCKTNFSASKFVVTHIGYDAGWKVTAKKTDGSTVKLDTYRVDGGLVGFIAPAGETSYVLQYEAPYLKTGLILATVGFLCYLTYETTVFAYSVVKIHRTMGLDFYGRPLAKGKKKKEDGSNLPPPSNLSL